MRDRGPRRSLHGCRSVERRWSHVRRWADRAGACDDYLWHTIAEQLLAGLVDNRLGR